MSMNCPCLMPIRLPGLAAFALATMMHGESAVTIEVMVRSGSLINSRQAHRNPKLMIVQAWMIARHVDEKFALRVA